ncbi:MAG: ABC transporter ATP-binding protein [Geminicoccaceae bacterium]
MAGDRLGKAVELRRVAMRFANFTAVHPSDLRIEAGEFFSILGPSGCGKTTILKMISGFLEPSEGDVLIGGESMRGIPPAHRPTSLIFQNLALFPLMTVWENVAFGLEARGVDRATRKRRADELLDLVALGGQGDKKPTELSGGQRQRVAIARGLAVEPAVLLLDEPLSALDLKLRQHMRTELRAIQQRVGITFVYITHDQGEALTMSDRIAVMSQGRIEQIASPDALYAAPSTPFVATFVGANNIVRGRVSDAANGSVLLDSEVGRLRAANGNGLTPGAEAILFVRPERLHLNPPNETENRLAARIVRRELEGASVHLEVATGEGRNLLVQLTNTPAHANHRIGDPVQVGFAAHDALALPPGPLAVER